tara:strand:+ start:171 stop:968 length:798 start_codon:yes stop_codon:yes gene_type:complete
LLPAARPIEAVAALGQLEPAGDVRRLAAPLGGFGGTPRVAVLKVREGDQVKLGQVLAEFDNRAKILADLAAVQARLETLDIQLRMQRREVIRYQEAAVVGASSLVDLEGEQEELVKFEGNRREALAELRGLEADLADSELKSPIDGVVLRVHTRVGERPGSDGVLEVGANQTMEALIEVYESDVSRVSIGQVVRLISENGGFKGSLMGRVERISPQVRQRKVLSTDPTGDADARVVEVRVSLDPSSALQVKRLTGMKVIARFKPS